jgi:hypothetical protein
MSPAAFDEKELAETPLTQTKSNTNDARSGSNFAVGSGEIPIPGDVHDDGTANAIEVPATRSAIADTTNYMHNLSLSPSMKERRGSRNSFGTSLPIPRSKRQSRLSSVHYPDGQGAAKRPGMPAIQPSRDIIAAQLQDLAGEKVHAAKDMAFVFDIDGVRAWHQDPSHLPHQRFR